jgi:putative aldouronate transport system permease protein
MYGITIAFKDYKISRGILNSPWIGFENFSKVFSDPYFLRALKNTLRLSVLSLAIGFPFPIIFSLLLNELDNQHFKRLAQTVSYLPHFLSWIVVAGFIYRLLSTQNGAINILLVKLGVLSEPKDFLTNKGCFTPIFLISRIWKEMGWSSILYLAAISGIDLAQYEAAQIEGASRLQRARYITLPGIMPTVTIVLLLNIGSLMSVSFDQIFNLYSPSTYSVADVISTFVYRKGLTESKYSFATAVGLFQNTVGLVLILFGNALSKKFSGQDSLGSFLF